LVGTFWDSAAVLEIRTSGAPVDTLGVWPRRVVASGPGYPYFLVTPHTLVTARGTRICRASSDERRAQCFDRSTGDTIVFRWSQARQPVTEAIKRQRIEYQLQHTPQGVSSVDLRRRLGDAVWPDSLPLIGEPLILESDGTLWVREYTLVSEVSPSAWRV